MRIEDEGWGYGGMGGGRTPNLLVTVDRIDITRPAVKTATKAYSGPGTFKHRENSTYYVLSRAHSGSDAGKKYVQLQISCIVLVLLPTLSLLFHGENA